jgi:TonB-linked SusC/RagA family outer membrane protein
MRKRTWLLVLAAALALAGVPAVAQQREISGTVSAVQGGQPLAGARVTIAGTSRGVNTGADGTFRIRTPTGGVRLRAAMLGYVASEQTVPAAQNTVAFRLAADALRLEQVVVTGQATSVARRNLANAVSTVAGEDVQRAPAQTIDKALQGKIPGAVISTNSGAPGGGVQINMRGVNTINASSDPLWVIDGVVVSDAKIPSGQNAITKAITGDNASNQDAPTNRISDLNPDDIASVEVLKGASAAAIYGSRAANGVIIVTTRRGREGRPRVSLTQRVGVTEVSNTLGSRAFDQASAVAAFGPAAAAFFNASGQPIATFDQERLLAHRKPVALETSASVSGGTPATRYYMSGLVQNEPGIIDNTGFQKQSVRLNVDQRLGERVEVSLTSNVLHTAADRGLTNNDNAAVSYYMVLSGTPNFVDLRAQNGVFPNNPLGASNPLQTAALGKNDENVWRMISAGTLNVDLRRGEHSSLKLIGIGGADYFSQDNALLFPPELQFMAVDPQPGASLLANSNNLNLNLVGNLVHTWNPHGGLTATTSTGFQFEDRDLHIHRVVTRDLVAGQGNINSGPSSTIFQNRNRVRDFGVYLQEEVLALDTRLLLTAGLRADRSSANGDPDHYFFYPKAAVSYRIPGLAGWFDDLKLRAAYGETGNQPLYGQKFTTLDATQSIAGNGGVVIQGIAGTADIKPERQRELEAGFDATLLDGRAQLEATVYEKRITDMLLQRTLAGSTGFLTQIFNGGELRNRGLELALSATPLDGGNLQWTSRTTFYTNKSTIESLPVPSFITGAFGSTALGVFQVQEGRSATQIVGRNGRDPVTGQPIEEQLGDATPQWKMGFSNELSYGAFSLYGLVDWQHGGDVINLTRLLYDAVGNSPDFALPSGISTPREVPACNPHCSGLERVSGFGTYTQQYIEDASYVKLRELALSWTLPRSVLARMPGRVQEGRITLSGRNLVTWTNYTGLDPEVSNFGNQQIARNVDVAPFPPSRSFWLTINLGL